MDFRKLLIKYMRIVHNAEGDALVLETVACANISAEEAAALKACEREAVPALRT